MSSQTTETEHRLHDLARGHVSELETLSSMGAGRLEATGLDAETFRLVQIAVLASVDASPASWVAHLEAADEIDLGLEKVLGTLIAIAPIVGTPRVVTAGARILHAMGLEDTSAHADLT